MRNYTRSVLIILIGITFIATPSTGRSQSVSVRRMLTIDSFTFGPVGYGTGRTSDGEILYNRILKLPTALEDFRYVWKHGNAQARAYAWTAFWKLDRVEFERDAAEFIQEDPTVNSQHVDIIGPKPAGWVVEDSEPGSFLSPARNHTAAARFESAALRPRLCLASFE
jgi:hypothetical protein